MLNLCVQLKLKSRFHFMHQSINILSMNEWMSYNNKIKEWKWCKYFFAHECIERIESKWERERRENGHKVRIILVFNLLSKNVLKWLLFALLCIAENKRKKNGSGCCCCSRQRWWWCCCCRCYSQLLVSFQLLLNSTFAWSIIIWSRNNNKKPHMIIIEDIVDVVVGSSLNS